MGYSDIFIYVGSSHFLGFKILNFSTFWGFQKNEYVLGYGDFVDIFGGYHKIELYLEVISMHFRISSRSMYRIGDIFGGC